MDPGLEAGEGHWGKLVNKTNKIGGYTWVQDLDILEASAPPMCDTSHVLPVTIKHLHFS